MTAIHREPPGPEGTWGIANVADFHADPLRFVTRCAREFGDVVRLGQDNYLLCHPRDIEHVFVNSQRSFAKETGQKPTHAKTGSYHHALMHTDGKDWLYKRRLLQPLFKRDRVDTGAEPIVAAAEEMIASWRPGEVRALEGDVAPLSAQVVGRFLLGSNLSANEVRRVTSFLAWSFRPLPIKIPRWLPTPRNLRFRWSVLQFDRAIYGLIERLRERSHGSSNLLELVQQARDGEDGCLAPPWYPRDEVAIMLLAAHQPTAIALAWTLYQLALHPEVDARVAAEVKQALGDRRATVEDSERLVYTNAVIKETLRLYPPVWMTARDAIQDGELGGYKLAAGVSLALSPWVAHRDPRWFADPDTFRPERWLDGSLEGLPKYAYFPFGGGPRLCMGASLAKLALVLVIATVVRRYRLTLAADAKVTPFAAASFLIPQGVRLVPTTRS
ncbi:cytochrome P450 [Archangium violaceum]|uniref:cytochrome P450 n=1 Tax=Archangium violaceum TaxID=83451 RepID=UPI002B299A9F|nr:cytochrome P450 [Archangium gephyra]